MFDELFRFILIAVGILYLIRAIVRWLLPMLFQGMVNKAQQQQQNQQQNYKTRQKPASGIKVDYVPENKKGKFPDNEGEFVDYEEVK
jgi:hypothetical protein